MRKVALRDCADYSRNLGGRLDHVIDQLIDRANGRIPPATRVLDAAALGDLAFLANDLGESLELLGHLLIEGDDFVENAGDFAIDAINLFGEAHREVAAAQRAKRTDELAAIDKVPRGLDVHILLRWLLSPPPRLIQAQPPGCGALLYQKNRFTLPEN